MTETRNYLSTAQHWDNERANGYNNLGWAKAKGPLDKIAELAGLRGNEVVVDAGTGSQLVLDRLSLALNEGLQSGGTVIGFDLSQKMLLGREGQPPKNSYLILADFYHIPFQAGSIDVLTARQVLHNLQEADQAILEIKRVLRPGGRFIGVEYVAVDDEVLEFERMVFNLKEPGRNLWTGKVFLRIVDRLWHNDNTALHLFNLEKYSVGNWMENSGLPKDTQQKVINLYCKAPESVVRKMNIVHEDGNVFTDRLFAHVVAVK